MSQANALELEMLALINEERISRGLSPLKLEQQLNDSAEDHSQWMLAVDTFSHTGAGGSSSNQRMRDAGFDFTGSWSSAENIAFQSERGAAGVSDDVEDLHNSLMNSSGHRANILNPSLEYVGIGIEMGDYKGFDVVMVTQNFASTSADVILDTGGGSGGGGDTGGGGSRQIPTSGNDIITMANAGLLEALDGDDRITGSSGNDEIRGNKGADVINAGGGHDSLYGGNNRDNINGGGGNDLVKGGNGADDLEGGSGNDTLRGGKGNDTINGQSGNDVMSGNKGSDDFIFSTGNDTITDFDASDGAEDIDLDAAVGISSYSDLVNNHMIQSGSHVLIEDDQGNSLLVKNTTLAELDSSDFLF